MKFLRYLVLFCSVVIGGSVSAQSQRELGQLMRNRGEYYFTLSVNKPAEIQAISEICSVDGTDGRTVVAYANQQEYEALLHAGYHPELRTPPSLRANVTMWNGQGTYNWNSYLTYPQYVSMMEDFPNKALSGRTCTVFSLGTLSTSNHRQLLGVRINNGSPEGKPKFLYSSTMHGDEITGMILMLRLINELCTSTDSRIVDLVNDLDIYILPLTNPDGTYNGGNYTVNNAKRYNGHNIDLNRNYKDYYRGDHPDGHSYEDETLWTMAMGDEHLFTMSANYHGGAEVMNYPWDAVYNDHADKAWYEQVCTEYVQLARQTYSSYMSDTYSDGVTNGADWYIITGSRQDYMNAYAQCREVTVECSSTKTPSASVLPNYWNYNRNSMLAFMEQALKGVHGFVHDAVTGDPIEGVTVTVANHDSETSFVTTHAFGDFHRPIKGGNYTFIFEKEGYLPQSVNVSIADGQRLELNDLQLTPDDVALQTINLRSGWNWLSSNVEADDLLDQLEEGLGDAGVQIKSQSSFVINYGSVWLGGLDAITNEQTLKVQANAATAVTLSGLPVSPANHPITLNIGWNWIGYPCANSLSLNEAFANFTPANGDQVKTQNAYAIYRSGIGWMGALQTLEPGKGLLYYSNTGGILIFPE